MLSRIIVGRVWALRRVGSNGFMSTDNQQFSVGNAYKGELVDVFVDETLIQVWSKKHLIKHRRPYPIRARPQGAVAGLHVEHQPKM
jgi:hypothetical protein